MSNMTVFIVSLASIHPYMMTNRGLPTLSCILQSSDNKSSLDLKTID